MRSDDTAGQSIPMNTDSDRPPARVDVRAGRAIKGLIVLLLVGSAGACGSSERFASSRTTTGSPTADSTGDEYVGSDLATQPSGVFDGARVDPESTAERAEDPAGDIDPRQLSWAPPELTDPITVVVEGEVVSLEDDQDYRVVFPDTPVRHGVVLSGGRNVVIIGGEINIPDQGVDPGIYQRRALHIRGQTGVVHIEGLLMTGEDLSEGINIDAPEAIVQLQNIRIEHLHARDQVDFTDNHPDVIQPWGGVAELRVDRLTAQTDYQGIFLKEDFDPIGPVTLRRVHIEGDPTARYLYWKQAEFDLTIDRSYVSPAPGRSLELTLWPDVETWSDLTVGAPPTGEFVPSGLAGIGYLPWPYAP